MIPTTKLRTKLRKLLSETVPPGQFDIDTNFLDSEIDDLLTEAVNIYSAAATGWTIKAGLLQAKTESYTVGQEKYNETALKDELAHALTMAQQYTGLARTGGSVILNLTPPEVL